MFRPMKIGFSLVRELCRYVLRSSSKTITLRVTRLTLTYYIYITGVTGQKTASTVRFKQNGQSPEKRPLQHEISGALS